MSEEHVSLKYNVYGMNAILAIANKAGNFSNETEILCRARCTNDWMTVHLTDVTMPCICSHSVTKLH